MDRFAPVEDQYDPHAVEDRVFERWDDVDAYERTVEHRSDGEPFYFVDGPPYTSGSAHMGHALNKTLKDCYVRYKRMCGHDVYDRPGYDMHGLPIETKVEEELGFENKKDIEEYGVEDFVAECRDFAEDSLAQLQSDFQSFGVWMDWEDPYKTVEPEYMEAAWWGFAQAHDRGLVEQGHRSISQCPRCETAIANNEVEYEDVEDPSIYVTMPLSDREGSLVIWTTTPWTIPANTFVAVGADLTYQRISATADGETEQLWIAESCVEDVLREGRYDDYEVVDEVSGEEMVGWTYEHPLRERVPDAPDADGTHQVYTADYVEADRTGLVHSAPGHGEEDYERGVELDLPIFCPVGSDGVFTEAGGEYAGTFVKDADDDVIEDLEHGGNLLAAGTTTHSYGHCWRCDTGIVQIVTDQWFITITDVKDDLLDNIEDAEWHPRWARDNRFRDFVEEAPDWNVSRQRYWGIPIPIWLPARRVGDGDAAERDAGGENDAAGTDGATAGDPIAWSGDVDDAIVIADREELAARADQDVDPESVDLHKGTVDDLTITEDGIVYERVPDVFDVWLDSSVATWGTLGYPADEDAFEELWPADLIIEAHDQTRGWFWSQLGMGTAALEQCPYEELLMHGHALMPDGRAMSKSKDIRVDPAEVIGEHGADPMRLFLLSVEPQGEDMQFSWDETGEMERRLNICWNVVRFPLPYMRADGVEPVVREGASGGSASGDGATGAGDATHGTSLADEDVADALELADRWILSRLQTVEQSVSGHLDAFENDEAVETLLDFVVEDVSRFYVQVVRERMWEPADSPSKRAAYATLYRVLEETVALLAPFAPLVADELYGVLTGEAGHPTVHMCDWPEPDESRRDPALEDEVAVVRRIEEAGSNARQRAERKLRWPVPRVIVDAGDADVAAAAEARADLVADRLNAREVLVLDPDETFAELAYSAEADMSVLGPALGDDAGVVVNALNDARVDEPTVGALEAHVADATGLDVDLPADAVEFRRETPDAVASSTLPGQGDDAAETVVYVDTTVTEDVEGEGFAREVVRRIQEMRKDLELDIEERIRVDLAIDDDRIAALVTEREDLISEEVRADEFATVEDGHRKQWDVEDVAMDIAIEPLAAAEPNSS